MAVETLSPDALPPAGGAGGRLPGWRPGLGAAPRHSEIFAGSRDGAGVALALALACDESRGDESRGGALAAGHARWLWVQDAAAMRLTGRPCRAGLPQPLRHGLVHVAAKAPEDALFALEEGLRCRDLAFVVGEIAGNPRALDFTASRRLSLAAERHGVPLWLVRIDAGRDLSSARMRWQAASATSPPPRWNRAAPGAPSWRAELFRARQHPPGEWILRDEGTLLAAAAPHHGDLVPASRDRSLAAV